MQKENSEKRNTAKEKAKENKKYPYKKLNRKEDQQDGRNIIKNRN